MSLKKEYEGKDVIINNFIPIYDDLVKGVSISRICRKLGISRQTWYNLVNDNRQFKQLIDRAEEEQAHAIKSSLVSKAQDRWIIKEKVLPSGKKVKYEEFIPADFNAIKFYLLNKLGEEFKEKQEITVKNTTIDVVIDGIEYQITQEEDPQEDLPLLEGETDLFPD